MKSNTPLDYAVFQLSPKRSRCELLVSSNGITERLASGLLNPFVTNLKFAEEQLAMSSQCIKLDIGRRKKTESWFTKGTLERFVRFVSTPEILESVNTLDAEMSQLESARRIYSQGTKDQHSAAMGGGGGSDVTAAADATKMELVRAIDLRLGAVQQDLATAYSRAAAAGFNSVTVLHLQCFADCFGARQLNDACVKFSSLCDRRLELVKIWKATAGEDFQAVRSSYGSDMSIEDDPNSPTAGSHQSVQQQSTNLFQSKNVSSTFHQTSSGRSSNRESSIERPIDASIERETGVDKQESSGGGVVVDQAEPSIQASQPSRRLSVQDRINLFENKQKEGSGSGGKAVVVGVGKSVELRRLSSDVSSSAVPEKAVLRRWSGASDMSIDLSCEKKDIESPLCTPSSSSIVSEHKKDTAISTKTEQKSINQAESLPKQLSVPSGKSKFSSECENSNNPTSIALQSDAKKDQYFEKTQSNNQPNFEHVVGSSINKSMNSGSEVDKSRSLAVSEAVGDPLPSSIAFPSEISDMKYVHLRQHVPVKNSYQKEDIRSRDHLSTQSLKAGDSGLRVREGNNAHTGVDRNSSSSQPNFQYSVETEPVQKKELRSRENLSSNSATKFDDSGHQKRKFEKKIDASEQIKKVQGTRDDSAATSSNKMVTENSKIILSIKTVTDNQDILNSFSTPPPDHVQRVRQAKGNQELNDELQMKANELEKLFAQHKLRVPVDQSNSTHRSNPADKQCDSFQLSPDNVALVETSRILKNTTEESLMEQTNMVDSENYEDALNKDLSGLSFSEGSRGKLYKRYMQKREVKLKEEWSTKRPEKEAKLKAMHDSLERSRAEMKIKFSGSLDLQGSAFSARRTERLRSFNKSAIAERDQKQLDFEQSDNDEDLSDFPQQKDNGEDQSFIETSFVENLGKNQQIKKPLPIKGSFSSTTRTPAAAIPRSAIRASNPSSGRRTSKSENPLAQSVPNFSELRKENSRASSAVSKTARSTQLKNYARSKTSIEEIPLPEEKPRRSQSLKKTYSGGIELRDASSLDRGGGSLTASRSDMEERTDKYSMNSVLKSFPKKSTTNDESEDDDFMFESDDLAKNEVETVTTTLHHSNSVNGRPKPNQTSFGLENDASRSASLAALPTAVPTSFNSLENAHDSPEESPISWNSRAHHIHFAYSHDTSDIDASVDSPNGSPASWNSHSLSQNESDVAAARMRKKWGVAQKPMMISNSVHNQTRKDMTKGFKRLLKFGRKGRGTEICVDWISATTSEGDDDTEDGRDSTYRLSEDLMKSRMGSTQGNPSDDSFNDIEFFSEQAQKTLQTSIPAPPANFKLREEHLSGTSMKVPRSFFSLSSFRSKASESKPR